MARRGGDLIDVVEAAYDVDAPADRWLAALASRIHARVDHGLGVIAYSYRIDPAGHFTLGNSHAEGMPPEVSGPLSQAMSLLSVQTPSYFRETFATVTCNL